MCQQVHSSPAAATETAEFLNCVTPDCSDQASQAPGLLHRIQAAWNVESGVTKAVNGELRQVAVLRNKGRCLKNRAFEGFLQLQTATAARHEDGVALAAESLAIALDKGKRSGALPGMRMHRTAACLVRRHTDTESLARQQRNE
jgi:hypothetical protein